MIARHDPPRAVARMSAPAAFSGLRRLSSFLLSRAPAGRCPLIEALASHAEEDARALLARDRAAQAEHARQSRAFFNAAWKD